MSKVDKNQRIAIVGLGAVFPGANDLESFWENILRGRDCSREPPADRWRPGLDSVYQEKGPAPDKVYSKRACFVEDVQTDFASLNVDEGTLAELDPMFHLLLHAGQQAWEDARTDAVDRSKAGIVIGNIALPTDSSSLLSDEILLSQFEQQLLRQSDNKRNVNSLNRYVAGLPAGLLAQALQLGGGSYTLDAACASSLYALKFAVDELQSGRRELMLCGGLSRPNSLYTQMGFSALHAISASGHCSPFDSKGDGLVVGEGAGILVLKRLDDALAQGDQIYATIAGCGLSNDIDGSLMSPDSEGQLRAMRAAYDEAGWQVNDVDLIECHGTGTPVGDVVEFNSLNTLWQGKKNRNDCVIGSVKSNIGHLLTAAGSAGLIKVLLAMKHGKLPPTANFEKANTEINLASSPFTVLGQPRDWDCRDERTPRRAAVSAFGFGGINAHVLIEQWDEKLADSISKQRTSNQTTQHADDIAIVGVDLHYGPWQSREEFTQFLFAGKSDCEPAIPTNTWGQPTQCQTFNIDKIDVELGRFPIPPNELKEMLPQQLLMLQIAARAIADAGIRSDNETLFKNAGVYIGIALDMNTNNFNLRWGLADKARQWAEQLGLRLSEEQLQEWISALRDAAGPAMNANRTMGALGGIVASRIARAFKVGGPSFTLSSEQSSGMRSLQAGVRALQAGEIDTAIVGAVDLPCDIRCLLSDDQNENKTTGPLPVTDGAAAFVLKRRADAEAQGDRVYALIKGMGAAHTTLSNGDALSTSLQKSVHEACSEAKVALSKVSMIEGASLRIAEMDLVAADAGTPAPSMGDVSTLCGDSGAAGAMLALAKASICLYQTCLPQSNRSVTGESAKRADEARYWLRDTLSGPRRALINAE